MRSPAKKSFSSAKTFNAPARSRFVARLTRSSRSRPRRSSRASLLFHPAITRRRSRLQDVKQACVCWSRCLKMHRPQKSQATRGYGAEVVFYDRHKQDREAFAMDLAERERLDPGPALRRLLYSCGPGNVWSGAVGRSAGTRLRARAVQWRWIVCGSRDGCEGFESEDSLLSRSSRSPLTTRDNRF